MNAKISVIIPTYYRNDVLPEAIESVLDQDYEPIELIVVDDSGEGHAEPILQEYDDLNAIIHETNMDMEGAYMTGVEASTGDYIQFLDDDDLLLDGKLAKTAEVLQENPDVGVSYCGLKRTNDGNSYYPQPDISGDVLESALRMDVFPCCTLTMLMRRDVLVDTMPFDYVDIGLMIELAQRTKFEYVDECLACYRREHSRKWVGLKMFEDRKLVVRQKERIYEEHPDIKRAVLADIYEREGRARLEQELWSAKAIACFLKAAYHSDHRLRCSGEFVSSLFGRPGLNAARTVRNTFSGLS